MAAATDPLEDLLGVERLLVLDGEEYRGHLATVDCRSVYMFEADSQGQSSCYDDCASAWPPLTPMTGAPEAGDGINANMIGTIERNDGIEQVTYDGQPLYAFVRDTESGETSGHKVEGIGGTWYLVSPDRGKAGTDSSKAGSDDSSEAVGSDANAGEPDAADEGTDGMNDTE